jgi:hypothetical protein
MTNRKLAIIKRKLKDLQKHYPNNGYEINDKHQIIRISGFIPHKTKEKIHE